MTNKKEKQAFIAGAEVAIQMIRENMTGSALRMFDLHSFGIEDLIKQIKDKNNL